jgi:hypothetical protein
VTPLLQKEGRTHVMYCKFLLLVEEEYPDRSVRERWWAFY